MLLHITLYLIAGMLVSIVVLSIDKKQSEIMAVLFWPAYVFVIIADIIDGIVSGIVSGIATIIRGDREN